MRIPTLPTPTLSALRYVAGALAAAHSLAWAMAPDPSLLPLPLLFLLLLLLCLLCAPLGTIGPLAIRCASWVCSQRVPRPAWQPLPQGEAHKRTNGRLGGRACADYPPLPHLRGWCAYGSFPGFSRVKMQYRSDHAIAFVQFYVRAQPAHAVACPRPWLTASHTRAEH